METSSQVQGQSWEMGGEMAAAGRREGRGEAAAAALVATVASNPFAPVPAASIAADGVACGVKGGVLSTAPSLTTVPMPLMGEK